MSHTVPEQPPILVTLQEPIPYRVVQKIDEFNVIICMRDCDARFDLKAPPTLTIDQEQTVFSPLLQVPVDMPYFNALLHCDQIYVTQFSTEFKTFPSKVMLYWNEYTSKYSDIMSYGTVLLGHHERSFSINHEEGYITDTYSNLEDDIFQCWSTDIKHFCQRLLPQRLIETIPRNRLEIGTVIEHDFLTLPKGSLIHEASNVIILPSSLKSCHLPESRLTTKDEATDYLLKISLVDAISRDRFPQYLIASSVYWHCLHLKDRCQKIRSTPLKWKFLSTGLAQVMYHRNHGIEIDKNSSYSTNFKNVLFRLNTDVMLIRHDPITAEESEPIVLKISKEKFEFHETMIGFEVDPRYLIDRWRLESEHDLLKAEYTMEPINLLSHLRATLLKMENEYYLDFLLQENSTRSAILEAFMPDSLSNERIYQIPNQEREARKDRKIKPGDSTFAQFIARNEINGGKQIIIIDGPPQTGKTDLMSYIVPDILKSIITSPDHLYGKCFALVSPLYTLRNLVLKLKQHTKYQQISHKIKVLDLTVWPADEFGSFLSVIQITLKKAANDWDSAEKLRKAQTAFHSKVQASNMEICDSIDSSNDTDLITSKELLIFQDAIKVIFAYYRPNFVIASNETFISLLPAMSSFVSHIAVDEAGKTSYLDCFAMTLEAPHLQQLILIGDTNQYPTHRRIQQNQLPDCFKNVMFEINWKSPALTYIQLNKTFYMNAGTVHLINKLFCPERTLTALYPTSLPKSDVIRNPELGIIFHDTDGWDAHIKPTSRKNYGHHYEAMQLIYQLLEIYPEEKITVLCYYVAQKLMMEKALRCEMINDKVEVSTVDGYYGKNTDIAIIITTRTLDAVKFLRTYTRIVKHKRILFRKNPMDRGIELGEDVEHFHFIFDFQRLLLALTRARKATFIIGSADLLKCSSEWDSLIQMTAENFMRQSDIPEQCIVQTKKQREEELEKQQQRSCSSSRYKNESCSIYGSRKRPRYSTSNNNNSFDRSPTPSHYDSSSNRYRRPRFRGDY